MLLTLTNTFDAFGRGDVVNRCTVDARTIAPTSTATLDIRFDVDALGGAGQLRRI